MVGTVSGVNITLADVDKKAAGRLARVRDEEYEARKQALEELVADKLTEREAAARRMSTEALLKAEIDDKVPKPEKSEIETLYTLDKDRVGGRPLAEVAPQIERQLLAQRLAERRMAFYDELKKKGSVQLSLPQPRTALSIPADAPTLGPPDAKVTVVEFLDYQCPYCHRVQGVVDEIVGRYAGKVRFVHRDFPLDMHPQAAVAARAAHCAGEQGRFWEYHENLLTVPGDMGEPDLRNRAAALQVDGAKFGSLPGLRPLRPADPGDLQLRPGAGHHRHADLLHQRPEAGGRPAHRGLPSGHRGGAGRRALSGRRDSSSPHPTGTVQSPLARKREGGAGQVAD